MDYACSAPDYFKMNAGPVQCRLGELVPDFPSCRTRSDRFGMDGTRKEKILQDFSGFFRIGQFFFKTDFGRISWQEFKGGSDITEGGIMFVERDKKSCAEPHRVHGSLVFRDSEPKEGEKRCVRWVA